MRVYIPMFLSYIVSLFSKKITNNMGTVYTDWLEKEHK